MRKNSLITITILIITMLLTSSIFVFAEESTDINNIPFSDVVLMAEGNELKNISVFDSTILLKLHNGDIKFTENSKETIDYLNSKNIPIDSSGTKTENNFSGFMSSFIEMMKGYSVLFIILAVLFVILKIIFGIINRIRLKKFLKNEMNNFDAFIQEQLRNNANQNYTNPAQNQSGYGMPRPPYGYNPKKGTPNQNAKEVKPDITLKDVEGLDELKEDIYRIIDYLKNPQKYKDIGARAPKGVILYGPPGTGKTLIAKAIAGEAGVAFHSAVGSDFCEKYVGVGAQRVRELYKKARATAPCIVFIDEVDAVAGKRDGEGNNEDERTTNALLAELDGFKGCDGVITICATNRLDLLDSAFQRAGRFDLKLAVNLPDSEGREKILKLHAKNKKMAKDINYKELSKKTIGFSGADIEALLNESALLAASKNKKEVSSTEIEDSFFKIIMKGNKKKNKDMEKQKKLVAWHEAGHTLATKLLTDDSVPTVTIVGSTSGAGGVTFRTPKEIGLHSKKYLENLIKVMYAGRAAEELYLGSKEDITTGASQDIKQATNIIKEYLSAYGMGEMGMLDLSQFSRDYETILEDAKHLSKNLYEDVLSTLTENLETLNALAENLYEKETLNEEDIDAIINNEISEEETEILTEEI